MKVKLGSLVVGLMVLALLAFGCEALEHSLTVENQTDVELHIEVNLRKIGTVSPHQTVVIPKAVRFAETTGEHSIRAKDKDGNSIGVVLLDWEELEEQDFKVVFRRE